MAKRAKTAADEVYNARKRYWRAAERNLKRAQESVGMASDKYKRQAEQQLKQAISTYDTSKTINFAKPIQRLANALGINLKDETDMARGLTEREKRRTINRSMDTLESRLGDDAIRREMAAKTILSNPTIGSRIYGGLVEVWKDKATVWDPDDQKYKVDNNKINELLTDYFGVDNIGDVLVKLEESIGDRLYEIDDDKANIYEVVKLMIQSKVADNSFIQ